MAIKAMHPHLAEDPEFVTMFLDEARMAANIRHPNDVPTLDVAEAAPGARSSPRRQPRSSPAPRCGA